MQTVSITLIVIYIVILNWSLNKIFITISKSGQKILKYYWKLEKNHEILSENQEKVIEFKMKNLWQPCY